MNDPKLLGTLVELEDETETTDVVSGESVRVYVTALIACLCACEGPVIDEMDVAPWQEIIFVRTDESGSALMTVSRDGTGIGVIHASGTSPLVAADGQRLTFEDGGPWLLVEGASAPVRLDFDPLSWSPVGARLAARLADGPTGGDLWVLDFDTDARLQMSHGKRVRRVAWAPDGRRLAYVDWTPELWVVDVERGESQAVARPADGDLFASWSPDARRLVYGEGASIYLYDLADGSSSFLAEVSPFEGGSPVAWSPDGEWIAWVGNVLNASAGIMRPDGSDPQQLPPSLTIGPSWSASSGFVSFLASKAGFDCAGFDCTEMMWLDVRTFDTVSFREVRQMSWSPLEDVAVVSQVRVSYEESFHGDDSPARLAVVDALGSAPTPLGDLAEDDLASDHSPVWRRASAD